MGVESRYASKYRSRLLAEGVIEQVARGVVRFAPFGKSSASSQPLLPYAASSNCDWYSCA